MRWDALFADLEAEADAQAAAERRSEVAERIHAEFGRLRLIDRLQPLLGRPDRQIRVGLPASEAIAGSVLSIGSDWLLLSQEGADVEWLVPLAAMTWIEGLGPQAAEPGWEGLVGAKFGLRIALRRLVRDRSTVSLTLVSGHIRQGRLARVGADHLVLEAAAEQSRASAGTTIPLSAIACLRRG